MYIILRCNWYTSFQKVMLRSIFIFITCFVPEVDLQINMKHEYNFNGYHVLLSKFRIFVTLVIAIINRKCSLKIR